MPSKFNIDKLEELFEKGLSIEQIASRLGMTKSNANYWIRKKGLKREKPNAPSYDTWTNCNMMWVAGLLEGEGSFTSQGITMQMHVRDIDIVERLQGILGGSIYGPYKNNIVQFQVVRKEFVIRICNRLLPYMGIRRSQQILKYLENYTIS